jgi:cytoskeletal protein RodZ
MMESIGRRLKEARLAKHLSIEDVSKETRIQPRILEALESDRFHEVLSPIYARGFIKKYADFLGLDSGSLVQTYLSQQPSHPKQVLSLQPAPDSPILSRLILPMGLFLVTVAVLGCLWFLGFKFWEKLKVQRPVRQVQQTAPAPVHATRRQPPQPAKPQTTKQTPDTHKAGQAKSFPIPTSEPLILTATTTGDDCWLRVKCDGKLIAEVTLAKNSQEKWEAKEKIELHVGNAGFLKLDLNGRPLGSPGQGVIKNILITREGMLHR